MARQVPLRSSLGDLGLGGAACVGGTIGLPLRAMLYIRLAGQKGGWPTIDCVQYGKAVTKTDKRFLATYHAAYGTIRVVIVKEDQGPQYFFCTAPAASVREILGASPRRRCATVAPAHGMIPSGGLRMPTAAKPYAAASSRRNFSRLSTSGPSREKSSPSPDVCSGSPRDGWGLFRKCKLGGRG